MRFETKRENVRDLYERFVVEDECVLPLVELRQTAR